MHLLDALVIIVYLTLVVGMGIALSRRAGRSADGFLVADRKLRWWVIGLSDVASDAGGDHLWVAMLFTGAFMAFFHVWWVVYAVSLPLAVLWARYWRRLRLVSPWEIYEVRYGGPAAARFRGFSALWACAISSTVILAYVLLAFAQIMAPFLGWSTDVVLLVFGGASVLYTTLSGLFGVALSDIPQFLLLLAGRVTLATVLVVAAGGMGEVLDEVEATRGADFLQPYPPGSGEAFGDYSLDALSLGALILAGLLGVSSTQSAAVQRSLAARSEADAAIGQMLNAVLSLAVRVAPLIVIGLVAVATYPAPSEGEPAVAAVDLWATMVREHAGPGLLGLLLVGVLAGYMSTIDTFLNFLTAGLFNDLYRRHLRPNASTREQVLFCRLATLVVCAIAVLWARVLIGTIDASWIKFVNTVVGLFVLPLGLLRWTWWRLNIWGEIVGFVGGFPLGYLVWFVLDFQSAPYWQAFAVLCGLGWGLILLVTFLTRPESEPVLDAFYRRVRPPGLWGPVARRVAGTADALSAHRQELRLDLGAAGAGLVFCGALVVGVASCFARRWGLAGVMGALVLTAGTTFGWLTLSAERCRRRHHL